MISLWFFFFNKTAISTLALIFDALLKEFFRLLKDTK